jgi:hypothetical protein
MPRAYRGKNWMFTLNNADTIGPGPEIGEGASDDEFMILLRAIPDIRYIVFQRERAETGTVHLQGYLQLQKKKTLQTVKSFIHPTVHLERRRGTHEQARAYCKKTETRMEGHVPQEWGEGTRQGERNDISSLVSRIRDDPSVRLRTLVEEGFDRQVFLYPKKISALRNLYVEPRSEFPRITWLYGPTGSGKSHYAREQAGPNAYWHDFYGDSGRPWWDGYACQDTVVFDEVNSGSFKLSYWLRLLDKYPFGVEVKGASVPFVARDIWITSNYAPSQLFPNMDDTQVAPFKRRFQEPTSKIYIVRPAFNDDGSRADSLLEPVEWGRGERFTFRRQHVNTD